MLPPCFLGTASLKLGHVDGYEGPGRFGKLQEV